MTGAYLTVYSMHESFESIVEYVYICQSYTIGIVEEID